MPDANYCWLCTSAAPSTGRPFSFSSPIGFEFFDEGGDARRSSACPLPQPKNWQGLFLDEIADSPLSPIRAHKTSDCGRAAENFQGVGFGCICHAMLQIKLAGNEGQRRAIGDPMLRSLRLAVFRPARSPRNSAWAVAATSHLGKPRLYGSALEVPVNFFAPSRFPSRMRGAQEPLLHHGLSALPGASHVALMSRGLPVLICNLL